MKLKHIFRIGILLIISIVSGTVSAQPIPADSLIRMSTGQFDRWLQQQAEDQKLRLEQVGIVVRDRLKNREGIPGETLITVLKASDLPVASKISFIDVVLPYTFNDRYLAIELYSLKSLYFKAGPNINDSLRITNALKLNPVIESEATRLLKIQYSNYLDLGDLYFSMKDTSKAIDYYIKTRKFPFYLQENLENREYFKNLYVQASIGHIKAYKGNYPKLKELVFVPAAYPEILPTYKKYIEDAGGKCSLCDEYLKSDKH